MRTSPPRPFPQNELYILTDRLNYVTACRASLPALYEEVERAGLLAPITIYHWRRNSRDWAHLQTFEWSV